MSKYEKAKHSKKCVVFFKFLAFCFFIVIVSCISYLVYNQIISNKNKSIYNEIAEDVNVVEDIEITENMQKVINLQEENQDVVGWLQIDNTVIDYPLLQTDNNEYYLTHNYKKEYSKYGSLFLKTESNILDNFSNIIIYGHNMKDNQMFHTLLEYESQDYYKEHQTITLTTEKEENEFIIVAVFKSRIFYQDETNVFRFYNYTNFDNEQTYNSFIENCKKIQLYDTGISAEYGEQLITLITCEYSQENGRFVVIAKKVTDE